MSHRVHAFAVAGAMASVVSNITDAYELSHTDEFKLLLNQCRGAASMAAAYASKCDGDKDARQLVIRHAKYMLEVLDGLPLSHRLAGVSTQLDFAHKAAAELKSMLKLLLKA